MDLQDISVEKIMEIGKEKNYLEYFLFACIAVELA